VFYALGVPVVKPYSVTDARTRGTRVRRLVRGELRQVLSSYTSLKCGKVSQLMKLNEFCVSHARSS
jgi:hypothetical protein